MAHTITYRLIAGTTLLCAGAAASTAAAQTEALAAPVASRNLAPLYANLGIPVMASARSLAQGNWETTWSLHWASHAVRQDSAGRRLEFDGETRRQDLQLRFGLSDRLTASVNLPYVQHSGGRLDSLVDGWHAFWGLPDGSREVQPQDRLRFAYDGAPGFVFTDSSSGPGDAEMGLAYQFIDDARWQAAGFMHYKLDSGDPGDFSGSGDRGMALGGRVSRAGCLRAVLDCHFTLGVADVGRPYGGLDSERYTLFAGASIAWTVSDSLALLAQLEGHATLFEEPPLDAAGTPLWLTLGLRWEPAARWLVDAQFSEDIAVGSAADITFRLGLARMF